MTNIDSILTHATLKEVRHLDYTNFLDNKVLDLDNLRELLVEDKTDKNATALCITKENQIKDLRNQTYDWIEKVGLKKHRPCRIVILIEELTDEE
jgi:hypothetical protein